VAALAAVVQAVFALFSPAFAAGRAMPVRFTCAGADVSPPLRWTSPPRGTLAYSLRLVDLDTHPEFQHWYLTGLRGGLRGLAVATRVGQGHRNDFGSTGYGGPCPPTGQTHHYLFELDALGPRGTTLAQARLPVTFRH
jgi:Raf kinase inhibitor-like YbhB/YbcL family protein